MTGRRTGLRRVGRRSHVEVARLRCGCLLNHRRGTWCLVGRVVGCTDDPRHIAAALAAWRERTSP